MKATRECNRALSHAQIKPNACVEYGRGRAETEYIQSLQPDDLRPASGFSLTAGAKLEFTHRDSANRQTHSGMIAQKVTGD